MSQKRPNHRPVIYLEPTRTVNINMPKSVIDWLDEQAAMVPHHSRSRVVVDLLEQLRLESLAKQFQYRP